MTEYPKITVEQGDVQIGSISTVLRHDDCVVYYVSISEKYPRVSCHSTHDGEIDTFFVEFWLEGRIEHASAIQFQWPAAQSHVDPYWHCLADHCYRYEGYVTFFKARPDEYEEVWSQPT